MALTIGVIGTADIASRRMIPAIKKTLELEYAGVAIANSSEWEEPHSQEEYDSIFNNKIKKGEGFVKAFGGKLYKSYNSLLQDDSINIVYIPLPPALHYKWAKAALEAGKHVLVEKPSTINPTETNELLKFASEKNLAFVENYGFIYHSQFELLRKLYSDNTIGDLRLIRACFGFPHRSDSDFRYSKKYGGGALLDCGGYTIKAVNSFLKNPKLITSSLSYSSKHDVDLYGSATLKENDVVAQISFGMDNSYKCDFELWGSEGSLFLNRAYTAPYNFETSIILSNKEGSKNIPSGKTDQFLKILERLCQCISSKEIRELEFKEIKKQSEYVFMIEEMSKVN